MNGTETVDGYTRPAHHVFMQDNYWPISWVAAVSYLIFITLGPYLMKNREPYGLQRPLFYWNFFLSLFSTAGVLSVMPEFAHTLYDKGLDGSVCWMGEQYQGYTGEWMWLFHASKLVELGDTFFLVMRKKPIKFLHWYHHFTVLVYAAYSYRYGTAAARWGVWMNFLVHSVMYCYFAYAALGHKWSRSVAPFVTGIQIAQFMAGITISIYVTFKVYGRGSVAHGINDQPCQCPLNVSLFQTFIYATYLMLFTKFFYEVYVRKSTSSKKAAGGKKVD